MRKIIFQIIEPNEDGKSSKLNKLFEWLIIILIILNTMLIFLDTFDNVPHEITDRFRNIELVTIVVFSIEYLLRVLTADLLYKDSRPFKARLRYIFSFMSLIDLMAILPFFLPFVIANNLVILRATRLLRLFRLLKISHYTVTLSILGKVLKEKSSQLITSAFILLILIAISSVIIYSAEHEMQPEKFENAFSSLWWSIVTITTIGFGDIYPVTKVGMLIGGVVSILGIGLVAIPTGIIVAGFTEDSTERNEKIAKRENHLFVADEIIKLKDLLDKGVLTQDEFDQKKTQLLNL